MYYNKSFLFFIIKKYIYNQFDKKTLYFLYNLYYTKKKIKAPLVLIFDFYI